MKRIIATALILGMGAIGCGAGNVNDGVGSEVATSVVSGALNNESGSTVGWNVPRKSRFDRMIELLSPIRTAHAASWTCMGGTLDPTFAGPGSYAYTPVSCSVTWANGKTSSSDWSGTFALAYGSSCDTTHGFMQRQAADCALTRTAAAGGNTRTITGPLGYAYAITHDTDGAGTGWDTTVSPAPSNGGVVLTCGAGGCATGATLVINGSHITGTQTPAGGASQVLWDHTVSTAGSGLTITGDGTSRVVSGSVTVQHNLAKFTSTTTFNAVGYGEAGCCFPTAGSVTTSFAGGPLAGKSETLAFSNICGEETLTTAGGQTESITLLHCL